ncbi:MAG: ABC transporter permease [Bacilli bacterium]|jgi:multidrug/hemolysin transport system permease protein
MIIFAIRNFKVFIRDRLAIFFSLLSVLIIFALYTLFLNNAWSSALPEGVEGGQALMDGWLMAGILAVVSFTTTLGAYGTMVDDKAKKIYKDFSSSPLKRSSLVGGYVISSYIIGVIMSLIALVFLYLYMLIRDGYSLGLIETLQVVGLIFIVTLVNSALVFFITVFVKSMTAFGTISTVVGTLMGFLAGIYMPVGNFPDGVQTIIKVFPVSHAASLFRRVIMGDLVSDVFSGAPSEIQADFLEIMGVDFALGDFVILPWMQIVFLVITAVIFYALSLLVVTLKKQS